MNYKHMVIGFDASRAFIDKKSGVENVSFQILKNLIKIDKINQYIIYTRSFINEPIGQLMKLPNNFQIKVISWPRLWTQGGLALRTVFDHLDMLFIPAHILPIFYKPNLKTVVMVYDFGSEHVPGAHSFKQRSILHFMEKLQLQRATKIITISNSTKSDLVNFEKVEPEKIEVVYLGVDNNFFKPTTNDILVNSLKYFLFVGTVHPRKNLERVIKAMTKFPKKQLLIVGFKGWLSNKIYALPKKLGIEDKVKFLGYVPDKDLPKLYSEAIALVFPSLFEGFGLPILEAQACGCPVITSRTSSMPEVAGKGAVLVDPYKEEEIVAAMIKVQQSDTRQQLVKKGFENVKRFSWEKTAQEILEVLEAL